MTNKVHQAVLIVNDEPKATRQLLEILAGRGMHGMAVDSGDEATSRLATRRWDMVIFDQSMFDDEGHEFMSSVRQSLGTVPIVAIGEGDSVERAVKAVRSGCEDFLARPISSERLQRLLDELLPSHEVAMVGSNDDGSYSGYEIAGRSLALNETIQLAQRVAPTSMPVLITGESGTGKELVSYLIHQQSRRADGPYIRVNCASLSESLLESDLFGHERGAFTGAHARRLGRFERANGGTILLDEISETGPRLQAELLRVLEQQDFERVGGDESISVDVRVISTSNRDLASEVAAGKFRADLYHRISGVHLSVAPLRERVADIEDLVWHFVNMYAPEAKRNIAKLDENMLQQFRERQWLGNVRQLRNVVRTALILGDGPVLSAEALPPEMAGTYVSAHQGQDETADSVSLGDVERRAIFEALRRTNSHHAKAADMLGITDRTLRTKLRRYRETTEAQATGEMQW